MRPREISGFVLESNGYELEKVTIKNKSDNLKKQALSVLERGLRVCRAYLKHEDLLIIEVQNQHLCKWLNGEEEQKDYYDEMDAVFKVLDTLDCRYTFIFRETPYAIKYLKRNTQVSGIQGSGIASMF